MIVYKVAKKSRSGEYVSAVMQERSYLRLKYAIGEITYPTEGTPVFAFSDLQSASDFAASYRNVVIFECEAEKFSGSITVLDKSFAYTNRIHILYMREKYSVILQFWKSNPEEQRVMIQKNSGSGVAPLNTVLCNWVKPVKIVENLTCSLLG